MIAKGKRHSVRELRLELYWAWYIGLKHFITMQWVCMILWCSQKELSWNPEMGKICIFELSMHDIYTEFCILLCSSRPAQVLRGLSVNDYKASKSSSCNVLHQSEWCPWNNLLDVYLKEALCFVSHPQREAISRFVNSTKGGEALWSSSGMRCWATCQQENTAKDCVRNFTLMTKAEVQNCQLYRRMKTDFHSNYVPVRISYINSTGRNMALFIYSFHYSWSQWLLLTINISGWKAAMHLLYCVPVHINTSLCASNLFMILV